MDQSNDNRATIVFVLGLLSIVFCQLLGPVAWIMGNGYVNDCTMAGVPPNGLGVAGRILGMVGTGLMALVFCVLGLELCLGVGFGVLSAAASH